MKKALLITPVIVCLMFLSGYSGWRLATSQQQGQETLVSPLLPKPTKPLLAYTLPALSQRQYHSSPLTVEKVLERTPDYTSYLFSYMTLEKRMTGMLNVPTQLDLTQPAPAIIMLRGYAPLSSYETGVGTRNASRELAKNGFVTLAPDFFGYGGSDPEPSDTWQARFEKPITVIELLKSAQSYPIVIKASELIASELNLPDDLSDQTIRLGSLGIWAHSNGGQIALSTLEILNVSIPTTLWAPVTAPFPYSILFFSDENIDEGKETRKWVSLFEEEYNVFDFSLTQHLDRLQGPLQLHHGTADEAALSVWSDEFVTKVELENQRRLELGQAIATGAAQVTNDQATDPIDISYFVYQGADHNLQPDWNRVMARDVEFFKRHLGL